MFDALVSKISNVVRAAIRSVDAAVRRSPFLATATIVALLLIMF